VTEATPDIKNTFIAQGVQLLNQQIEAANVLAEAGQRAEQTGKLVFEIRDAEDTQDQKIKAYQTKREKALKEMAKWEADIEDYIRQNYEQFNGASAEAYDPEKTAIDYKALADTIKGTMKALEQLNGGALEGVTELKSLPGTRRASGNSGQSGIKRPRFETVQVREAGKTEWQLAQMDKRDPKTGEKVGVTSNLSAAAALISKDSGKKVTAGDLQGPLFEQAKKDHGTQDLDTLLGKEIVFVVNYGDKNYEIQAIPGAQK